MHLKDYYKGDAVDAMTAKWGDRLERMDARNKLDAIWTITTNIGHCDRDNEPHPIDATINQYGGLLTGTDQSEAFLELLMKDEPRIDALVAVLACLTAQLHGGYYKKGVGFDE
jgi:hypothetical protein